jgi:hypothetical protein
MDGTSPRIYDHESQRFHLVQKGNALCALRTLLPATSPSATTIDHCQSYPEHDLTLLGARQEEIRNAHGRLRHLLKRVKRPPMLSMTVNGAINAWDGSTLKAISADRDGRAWVATEPVTNCQYESFIQRWELEEPPTWNRPEFRIPELPVVGVTWFEAMLYAAWAGGELLTESEWMRAATLADPGVTFATATGEINPQLAHYNSRFGYGGPVAVTTFAASQGGYYGMCGNTWDWCGSDDAGYKVIKGGGYTDSPLFCRIQARYRNSPLDRDCNVGFRIKVIDSD